MSTYEHAEASFAALITHLSSGSQGAEQALAQVDAALASLSPGSLTADQHKRIKTLHGMALSMTRTSLSGLATEIERVQSARQNLRSLMRSGNPAGVGDDCDMRG